MAEPQPGQQMTPEQVEELKEKIKNMSPEELREFQKKQCIFCHIVSGKVQAKKIYEDDKCLAVLDINPANPGHILLLPKEHYAIMPQIPDEEIEHIFIVAKALSNAALKSLEATGTNIIVANGPAAGQKAQHFMAHIIPRKENDDLSFNLPQNTIAEKELDSIMKKVSAKLSSLLGEQKGAKAQQPAAMPKAISIDKTTPKAVKKVIDAKFEEKKEKPEAKKTEETKAAKALQQQPKEKMAKEKKTVNKKESIKPEEKKPEAKKEGKVNLDDIAKVLGVK